MITAICPVCHKKWRAGKAPITSMKRHLKTHSKEISHSDYVRFENNAGRYVK